MRCERIEGWEGEYSKIEAGALVLGIAVLTIVRMVFLIALGLWLPVGAMACGPGNPAYYYTLLVLIGLGVGSSYLRRRCQVRYMQIRGLREV